VGIVHILLQSTPFKTSHLGVPRLFCIPELFWLLNSYSPYQHVLSIPPASIGVFLREGCTNSTRDQYYIPIYSREVVCYVLVEAKYSKCSGIDNTIKKDLLIDIVVAIVLAEGVLIYLGLG